MKNKNMELIAGEQSLAGVEIKRFIFQRDSLSSLLYVRAMMPLTYVFRKCTGSNKFTKPQEKINQLVYDVKIFA